MPFLNIFSKKKDKEKNEKKNKILIDFREKNSLVPSYLIKEGFDIEFKQLAVGDYIVNEIVIERKTISDFKNSIINKRIITQLLELKQFEKKLLLIEGNLEQGLSGELIHENAFRGFLLSVALEFNIHLIFTLNEKDTAFYISVLAKKEKKEELDLRISKIFLNEKEQALFILKGFPYVGPVKAKKLLEKFSSLQRIFNSSSEELKEILGKRAEDFKILLEKVFNS